MFRTCSPSLVTIGPFILEIYMRTQTHKQTNTWTESYTHPYTGGVTIQQTVPPTKQGAESSGQTERTFRQNSGEQHMNSAARPALRHPSERDSKSCSLSNAEEEEEEEEEEELYNRCSIFLYQQQERL
ncbi:hypothetical protein V1264_011011 [Littorina saxatilis]|uniref:Uncharacterized protein n=1 Tax=Littorina saxatilis TaxID=31220 RepID=A0AAN9BUG2_9CAEN